MEFQTQKARYNMYALLSRILMQEADVPLIDTIKSDSAMQEFFPNFVNWSVTQELTSDDLAKNILAIDYATTFFIYLIPYESFYRRDDGMVNSGDSNPVIEFYRAYGFEIDLEKGRVLSADHIAVELEFMASLIQHEITALTDGDETYAQSILIIQKRFLEEHLLQWAPLFLSALATQAETPLYRDAASVALDMILSDHEYLIDETAVA